MPSIRFTREARKDIESLYDYTVSQWGRDQADFYLDGLQGAINGLPEGKHFQRAMPEWRKDGFRLKFQRHIIFFVVDEHQIVIARVLHERRNFLRHLPEKF